MMLKLLAVEASGMDVGSSTSAIYSLFVPLPVPVPSADGSVVVSAFGSLGAAQAPSRPIAEMDTALTAAPFNRFLLEISDMVPPSSSRWAPLQPI